MPTTMQNRPPRRLSARLALLAATAGLALSATSAQAAIEENYAPGEPPITTTWFAAVSEAAQRADRDYVAGMRPHHAGALTMSRDYLADPGRSSPLLQALSRAIVANQTFEIGVLDEVGRNLDRPPLRLPFGLVLQPVATEGLTGAQRFFKQPIPSAAGYAVGPVNERDVQFAKAMILHHEGAVEMARGYHADRNARNGFLGLMNVDIITDQTQEIAIMRQAIAAYPGDVSLVRVDPSMIHGMEGMRHGAHGSQAVGTVRAGGEGADHGEHGAHGTGGNPVQHGDHGGSASAAEQPRPAPRARPAVRPSAVPAAQGHQHHHH